MNPSKKNKLFSKYMAGDISQDEMHELNQYALEDDFLFEALEGAAGFEVGNKNSIEDLNARLKSKNKKKRSPFIIWTSVAATIAILIIAFTFIPDLEDNAISDVVIEKETQVTLQDDEFADGDVLESEAEITEKNKTLSAPLPPAAKTSPKPIRSEKSNSEGSIAHTPKIDNRKTNTIQPEKDLAPLETITLADAELKQTENSEVEIDQIEPSSTLKEKQLELSSVINEESSNKVRQSAPKPVISQARKKKESSRNKFLDQGISEGAKAETLEEEPGLPPIRITYDDEKIGLQFQNYISQNFNPKGFSGDINIEMIVDKNQETTKIDIKTPLNNSQTRKIKDLVESFKEWGEAGNKSLQIMFND